MLKSTCSSHFRLLPSILFVSPFSRGSFLPPAELSCEQERWMSLLGRYSESKCAVSMYSFLYTWLPGPFPYCGSSLCLCLVWLRMTQAIVPGRQPSTDLEHEEELNVWFWGHWAVRFVCYCSVILPICTWGFLKQKLCFKLHNVKYTI